MEVLGDTALRDRAMASGDTRAGEGEERGQKVGPGHSHDVSEHTRTPDVCGGADGVSLHHLRS